LTNYTELLASVTPSWNGLKKSSMGLGFSQTQLRPRDLASLIDPNHPTLTIAHQAELLGVSRDSYYYQPVANAAEQARLKLHLDAIDEIYTKYPFYGTRRMQYELETNSQYDIHIGRERIRHLMAQLGLEAIYPKPNTSKPAPHNATYPYLSARGDG